MDDLNTLWSKLLSDYARIKNKATKLSGGYQAFIDAAAALIRQCYGALSSLTDNEYTVDGGTPFTQIDVITELVTESGPIVSFDTKLHSSRPIEALIVDIDPVQDLHGYDYPWVAGGGINKLPPMVDGTYTGNGLTAVVKNGVATLSGTSTASGNALIIPLAEEYTVTQGYLHLCNSVANASFAPSFEGENISASLISYACSPVNRVEVIPSDKVGQVWTRVRVWVSSGVTISGTFAPMVCEGNTVRQYAPYENICPISGWNGVNIYDDPVYPDTINWNQKISNREVWPGGGSLLWNDNEIEFTVTELVDAAWKSRISFLGDYGFYLTANDKFIISFDVKPAHTRAMGVYIMVNQGSGTNKYIASQTLIAEQWNHVDIVESVDANVDRAYVQILVGAIASNGYAIGDKDLFRNVECFNLSQMFGATHEPSTITEFRMLFPNDYYPYNEGEETIVSAVNGTPHNHVNIQLNQTVYDGTLNPLTGVVTVDKVALVIDGVNTKFNQVAKYGALNRFGVPYPTGLAPKYVGSQSYCISDKLTPSYDNVIAINTTRPEGYYCFPHTSALFVSMPSSVISGENASEANAWAAANTPTICYELATPYEIQLTPQEIKTLIGNNNIWADAGDVTVTYPAKSDKDCNGGYPGS